MEHSIRTPTASPINRKPISAHTGGNLSDEEDLLAFSFLKNKVNLERSKQLVKGQDCQERFGACSPLRQLHEANSQHEGKDQVDPDKRKGAKVTLEIAREEEN
jgi:hypothetical protein